VGNYFVCELWKAITKQDITWSNNSKAESEINNIDVHIYDKDKRYLAIELKVDTDAHSKQLERYANILEKMYPGYDKSNRLLIFIRPDGKEPDNPNQWDARWVCFSYDGLYEILDNAAEKLKNENYKFKSDSRKLILDFKDDLHYSYGKFCGPKLAKEICLQLTDEDQVRAAVTGLVSSNREDLVRYIEEERHTQRKTASQEGQELIRRLFNELAIDDNKRIDCSDPSNFGEESTKERLIKEREIKQGVIHGKCISLNITKNKGQGLRFIFEGGEEIYLSVGNQKNKKSAEGFDVLFPNDGVQFRHKFTGEGKEKPRVGLVESDFIVRKRKNDKLDVHTALEKYGDDEKNEGMFGKRLFNRINEFLEEFFTTNEMIYDYFWDYVKDEGLNEIEVLTTPAMRGSMVEFSTKSLKKVFGTVNPEDNPQGIENVAIYGIRADADKCWLYLCLTATKDTSETELQRRLELLKKYTGADKSYYANKKNEIYSYIYHNFAETRYIDSGSTTLTKEIVDSLVKKLLAQENEWNERFVQ
jgi:hypothetical protein